MARRARWGRRVGHVVVATLVTASVLAFSSLVSVVAYKAVNPPHTPLMVIRAFASFPPTSTERRWTPLRRISPNLVSAVMASEDMRFCTHHGFDWHELRRQLSALAEGRNVRGASTISNQTAKNVFLWTDRAYFRKLVEATLTLMIEQFWGKRRIMEVYLNVAEWGDGVYGAEAAAQRYFGVSAERLNIRQSALLAVALPNPRVRNPAGPSAFMQRRATVIVRRMGDVPSRPNEPCPRS